MSMPHLCSGHEDVMSCDGWDEALKLGENFGEASHVVTILEASSIIEGQ
jgi:hypothetical protein